MLRAQPQNLPAAAQAHVAPRGIVISRDEIHQPKLLLRHGLFQRRGNHSLRVAFDGHGFRTPCAQDTKEPVIGRRFHAHRAAHRHQRIHHQPGALAEAGRDEHLLLLHPQALSREIFPQKLAEGFVAARIAVGQQHTSLLNHHGVECPPERIVFKGMVIRSER